MVYPLATRGAAKKLGFSGVTIRSIQASNSLIAVLFLLDETTFIRIICNSQSISQSSLLRVLYSRTLNILHTTQSSTFFFFSPCITTYKLLILRDKIVLIQFFYYLRDKQLVRAFFLHLPYRYYYYY